MLLWLASLFVSVSLWYAGGHAQRATCQDGYGWAFNSLGQSPCELAGSVVSVCTGNGYNVNVLGDGRWYSGPKDGLINECVCSTVKYTLTAACAMCQGRNPSGSSNTGIQPFTQYMEDCSTIYQGFPRNIPPGLAIPRYAYLPLGPNDRVDTNAMQRAGGPDSTHVAPPTPTPTPAPSQSNPTTTRSSGTTRTLTSVVVTTLTSGGSTFVDTRTQMITESRTEDGANPTGGTSSSSGSPASTTSDTAASVGQADADDSVGASNTAVKINTGGFVGAVVGGIIGGLALASIGFFVWQRAKRQNLGGSPNSDETIPQHYIPSSNHTRSMSEGGTSLGIYGTSFVTMGSNLVEPASALIEHPRDSQLPPPAYSRDPSASAPSSRLSPLRAASPTSPSLISASILSQSTK